MARVRIRVTVNGVARQADVDPRVPLVHLLRDEWGLTGTRFGCLTGHCGACTVLVNGAAVKACTVLAASADGDEVVTVEGLASDGQLHSLQQAFWDHHGFQCGFCTPGMIMTAVALLAEHPQPSEAVIRDALAGNLCRCTGYQGIVEAIQSAAESQSGAKGAR